MIPDNLSVKTAPNWAVVIPLSNESSTLSRLVESLQTVLDSQKAGTVYFVVDESSRDSTFNDTLAISANDVRFKVLWRPEVKNVVQAYLAGFSHACEQGHDIIIEMDGGLAHDPIAIPQFLECFSGGFDCVFGSRFCKGGSLQGATPMRMLFSRGGTALANFLLGTKMKDMTSGFQGFRRSELEKLLRHPLKSTGHFYQTEVRYLLRNAFFAEVPIHYMSDGRSIGKNSLKNAIATLFYYVGKRVSGARESVGNNVQA